MNLSIPFLALPILALLTASVIPSSQALDTSPRLPRTWPFSSKAAPSNETLYLTAVVNAASPPYHAAVECWALAAPLTRYPTVGMALDLGDVANASYVVLPPRSEEGWHRPPHPMFFVLLSGLARVDTPRANAHTNADTDTRPINPRSSFPQQQDDDEAQSTSQAAFRVLEHEHEHESIFDSSQQQPVSASAFDSLYIVEGVNPLIVAVDTDPRAPGHLTFYPSDKETVALQVPFRDGRVLEHTVVHRGPCRGVIDGDDGDDEGD